MSLGGWRRREHLLNLIVRLDGLGLQNRSHPGSQHHTDNAAPCRPLGDTTHGLMVEDGLWLGFQLGCQPSLLCRRGIHRSADWGDWQCVTIQVRHTRMIGSTVVPRGPLLLYNEYIQWKTNWR